MCKCNNFDIFQLKGYRSLSLTVSLTVTTNLPENVSIPNACGIRIFHLTFPRRRSFFTICEGAGKGLAFSFPAERSSDVEKQLKVKHMEGCLKSAHSQMLLAESKYFPKLENF